ncbi:MAG: hypothetical protein ACC726_01765 [Chloroflexota bacterium]
MTASATVSRGVRACLLAAFMVASIGGGATVTLASEDATRSDVCLELAPEALPEGAWEQVIAAVMTAVASRPALFPNPAFTVVPTTAIAAGTNARLDIMATDLDEQAPAADAVCLAETSQWTARLGRSFLDDGADRMLKQAPTTPGISSSVEVQWFPDENRVLTTLEFAGPFDIPNGRCWIDDSLSIDEAAGTAVASADQDLKTSPFAEGACGRFFDFLVDGGAGEQAISLLPSSVPLDDGSTLYLLISDVSVEEQAIVISGSLEIR